MGREKGSGARHGRTYHAHLYVMGKGFLELLGTPGVSHSDSKASQEPGAGGGVTTTKPANIIITYVNYVQISSTASRNVDLGIGASANAEPKAAAAAAAPVAPVPRSTTLSTFAKSS